MLIRDGVDSFPVILVFAHRFQFSVQKKKYTGKVFRTLSIVNISHQTKPQGDRMDYRNNSPQKRFECRVQNNLV